MSDYKTLGNITQLTTNDPLQNRRKIMSKTNVRYSHYGMGVTAREKYQGCHKDICICHSDCCYFKPEEPSQHCNVAAMAYQLSREVGIVLVMACKRYRKKQGENNV